MAQVHRVLDAEIVPDLTSYLDGGGGRALAIAVETEPGDLIGAVEAAGLRGRGGAGFPTAVKWATVARSRSDAVPTSVVVNAAEGEPGTFKDRAILRRNPFRVLEGALVAARAVGAPEVVVAIKASFVRERERVEQAIRELHAHGLVDVTMRIVDGPSAYLFGEESALLEVVEGRQPFPRVTPPYRRGLDDPTEVSGNSSAWVDLAAEGGTDEPPALVDNVETLANVPGIIAEGIDWFRALGTEQSPGTIVCTVTGDTRRHGVGEFPMGTPLWQVIDELGGGPRAGRTLVAAISGTANPVLEAERFETPLTYEDMRDAGSGLGSAGFIVVDDETDLASLAHGIARFLAVESCGQCTPCKQDGLAIADALDAIRTSSATHEHLVTLDERLGTVADGARCALAGQQQLAVGSLVALDRTGVDGHVSGAVGAAEPVLVAPIVDIVDDRAVLDEEHARKQPDWSTGEYSGAAPADLYGDEPVEVAVSETRRSVG